MAARVHGRNPDDLAAVLARFRAQHRDDALSVREDEDGWEVTCGWWHAARPGGELTCCPPGGHTFGDG